MGILDGIVEWIAEQVMYGLDLINTSVLGALGCDMTTFLRYFPAAETMYNIFVALAIGMILLNLIWQLFKNYGLIAGVEAEDPVKLTIRSVLFILLAYFADEIVELILKIGGTPYAWIMSSELPTLNFADFNSVILTILGVCANGAVALIALILVLILAWNYTASAEGYSGPVTVEVEFDGSSILSVHVLSHSETVNISDRAIDELPSRIVEAQTWDVDAVSSATFTSDAIREAVRDCLAQAALR